MIDTEKLKKLKKALKEVEIELNLHGIPRK